MKVEGMGSLRTTGKYRYGGILILPKLIALVGIFLLAVTTFILLNLY